MVTFLSASYKHGWGHGFKLLFSSFSGLNSKIMGDKLIYNSNDSRQNDTFCRTKLLVGTFKHNYIGTNQSKFNKYNQSLSANDLDDVVINHRYECNLQSNLQSS